MERNDRDPKSEGAITAIVPPDIANQQTLPIGIQQPTKRDSPKSSPKALLRNYIVSAHGLAPGNLARPLSNDEPLPQDLFPRASQGQDDRTIVPERQVPNEAPQSFTQPSRRCPADAASTLCTVRICAIILSRLVNPYSP